MGVAASSQETSYEVTADDIDADVKVIKDLYDLEDVFSNTMTDTRKDLKDCDIEEVQFYLDDLVGVDEFRECKNIDEVLRKLRHDRIDTFNINYLKCLISRFHQNKAIVQKIEKYEEKKEEFLRDTTVKQFQQAVVSKAEAVTPKGMAKVTIKIPKEYGVPRTMKDVEELAIKGFKECKKDLVKIEVKPGSVIITWLVPEDLYGELVRLTRENIAVLREKGVEEVSIVGKKSVTISTQDGCEVNPNIDEQKEALIAELRIELRAAEERLHAKKRVSRADGKKSLIYTCIVLIIAVAVGYYTYVKQEELQNANKLLAAKETELKMRVGDLEFILSHFQVQVTGEEKDLAIAGKETSFELNLSSVFSSFPFLIKDLSCQLKNPHHQHIHCSITSTQPGVCTVKYTPTLGGPHQLRITFRDIEIAGSPFTVHVLPSPEERGVVQHTIKGIIGSHGVAVSKSGEVVVSEYWNHCISVYSREGKKIRSFESKSGQFKYPRGVAITSDNHILIADGYNHRIQMFTMEGKLVKSVGRKGQKPLQFNYPSGIAVHPSGRVLISDSSNHRIQVLNQDLSFSHMFGSESSKHGQFYYRIHGVAINSIGVVYVTDYYNHRVQLFSADEQFISSFGSKESQHGQLHFPTGICVDSTNTVYVTDLNHRVSVYTSSGQFIKSFGTLGSGEGKLSFPEGVAVDNTTGELYVCDYSNDRVVVY